MSENPMVNTVAEPVTVARRRLSRGHRAVLVMGMLLVGVSVACPPWQNRAETFEGYHWLWDRRGSSLISWDRLAAQIVGILAATVVGLLAVGPLTRSSIAIARRMS